MPISLKLLQEIVYYLEGRPFREVAPLLMQIKTEFDASQKPTEAAPVADEAKPEDAK